MMRKTALAVLGICLGAVSTAGADGMLDPSFGKGGLVTTNFPGSVPFAGDAAYSLVVLPDGRAVAAGVSNDFGDISMAVARYLPSGALDTSFSGDGMTTICCPTQSFPGGDARKVLLQPDGRLVLIGYWTTGGAPELVFWLARLNIDGSLDPSFGTGGQLITAFANNAFASSGVLQPDGRIVAVGRLNVDEGIAAARYNTDGSLDSTFGAGGKLTLTFAQGFIPGDVVLQPDGKLVIGGTYGQDFGLVRLLPDGALDPSFDGDGLATANFGGTESGYSVIVLPDGRLVLGGSHNADFGLVRFLAGGSVDGAFGTGGLATASYGLPVTPDEAILLPNGNLVIAGFTDLMGPERDFLLARFLADGALDATFGTGGFLRTDFSTSLDNCYAMALAGPDLILTAGGSYDTTSPSATDFALARYIASTPVELLNLEVE